MYVCLFPGCSKSFSGRLGNAIRHVETHKGISFKLENVLIFVLVKPDKAISLKEDIEKLKLAAVKHVNTQLVKKKTDTKFNRKVFKEVINLSS